MTKLQSYWGAPSHGRKGKHRAPSRGRPLFPAGRADAEGRAVGRAPGSRGWLEQELGWGAAALAAQPLVQPQRGACGGEAGGGGHGFCAQEQSPRPIPGARGCVLASAASQKLGGSTQGFVSRPSPVQYEGTAPLAERPGGSSCRTGCTQKRGAKRGVRRCASKGVQAAPALCPLRHRPSTTCLTDPGCTTR